MASPSKNLIMSDLISALEGITVANGYKSNVQAVLRTVQDYDSVRTGTGCPAITLKRSNCAYEYRSCDHIDATLTVDLLVHVDGSTDAARYTAIDNLEDDIIAAVSVDITRGGNAIETRVRSTIDDTGDPDTMDSRGGGSSAVITIDIMFERTTAKA